MPCPITIITAATLGAIGTMLAAGSDDQSEEDSSFSSSDDPCDWSYDDSDYGSSGGDRQTTLSEFD